MKFLFLFYIAFGCAISLFVGIEYRCTGEDIFPVYYGNPFIFKRQSLASSMEFQYNVVGILLNTLIWFVVLFLLQSCIQRFFSYIVKINIHPKVNTMIYSFLFLFASLQIVYSYLVAGNGFSKNENYWYWHFAKETAYWQVHCEANWKFFP